MPPVSRATASREEAVRVFDTALTFPTGTSLLGDRSDSLKTGCGNAAVPGADLTTLGQWAATRERAGLDDADTLTTPSRLRAGGEPAAPAAAAGATDVVFYPCSAGLEQVDLLAEAARAAGFLAAANE
jgi:hypothetical protein